jgi:hypothetical protein
VVRSVLRVIRRRLPIVRSVPPIIGRRLPIVRSALPVGGGSLRIARRRLRSVAGTVFRAETRRLQRKPASPRAGDRLPPPLRIAYFDSGLRWDNPNFRWGDPSYVLEPGDPGYVFDPNDPSPAKPQKTRTMKQDPIPSGDNLFAQLLTGFKNAIAPYATLFGLTPAQVTAQAADADYFAYALACQQLAADYAQQWTGWKGLIRDGGTPPASGMPQPLTLPAAVAVVALGIEARFRALVAYIKKHAAYNESIGQALGIEGAEITGPDYATLAPELKLEQTGAGVMVRWGWMGKSKFLDLLEIQVDRGDGAGFVLLSYDTTPNYLDTHPVTVAAKWTYRAIFRVADARVGQWSGPVSINVAP